MAGFLSKFVRGASTAGATLYADQHRQQIQADILAKRDQVLQDNRTKAEASRRVFETEQSTAKAQAKAESPQTKIAEINLQKAEKLQGLQKRYSEAKSSKEKLDIVKNIMVTNNKPIESVTSSAIKPTAGMKDVKAMVKAGVFKNDAEAWKFLKGGSKNLVVPIFKALNEAQEYLEPGDEGYKDIKTLLSEAKQLARGDTEAPTPTHTPTPTPEPVSPLEAETPANVPTIDSQSDYDTLPSGSAYIDKADGKRYRKP